MWKTGYTLAKIQQHLEEEGVIISKKSLCFAIKRRKLTGSVSERKVQKPNKKLDHCHYTFILKMWWWGMGSCLPQSFMRCCNVVWKDEWTIQHESHCQICFHSWCYTGWGWNNSAATPTCRCFARASVPAMMPSTGVSFGVTPYLFLSLADLPSA